MAKELKKYLCPTCKKGYMQPLRVKSPIIYMCNNPKCGDILDYNEITKNKNNG